MVKKLNIAEVQSRFPELLDLVAQGESVTICRDGQPIAQLVPLKRKAGAWKGKAKMADDFDNLPEEFLRNFK